MASEHLMSASPSQLLCPDLLDTTEKGTVLPLDLPFRFEGLALLVPTCREDHCHL